MSNMSYCAFRNTLTDLVDCQEKLEALFHGEPNEDGSIAELSDDELRAAKALTQVCFDIVRMVGDAAGRHVLASDDDEYVENSIEEIFNEQVE